MEAQTKFAEEQMTLAWRKQTEHKANPIRKYKPVPIMSPLPLTEPKTPNFKKRIPK